MTIKDELQSAILRTRWPDGSLVDRLSASTSELIADQIISDLGLDNPARGAFLAEHDREVAEKRAEEIVGYLQGACEFAAADLIKEAYLGYASTDDVSIVLPHEEPGACLATPLGSPDLPCGRKTGHKSVHIHFGMNGTTAWGMPEPASSSQETT